MCYPIRRCSRSGQNWEDPEKLEEPINSNYNEFAISMASDSTIIFCSSRPGGRGDFDIYISDPINNEYINAVNLENLNSTEDEYSAFIAPDKSYIILSSQKSGYGWDDLYISFRNEDSTWTDPVNLGPRINTNHAEFSPHITPDNKYLVYSKWDVNSQWSDIYWVSTDIIFGPYLAHPIEDQLGSVNREFSFIIPDNAFTDFEGDDSIT